MSGLKPNPQSLVDAIRRGDTSFAAAGGPDAYFRMARRLQCDRGPALVEALGAIIEDAVVEVLMSEKTDGPRPAMPRDALHIIRPPELEAAARLFARHRRTARMVDPGRRGQTAAEVGLDVTTMPLAEQFDVALAKVLQVVKAGGAAAEHVTRMTIYVTDLDAYRASRAALGPVWRRHMNRHYPAMTLVQVSGLVDAGAVVEIQADAVVPPRNAR